MLISSAYHVTNEVKRERERERGGGDGEGDGEGEGDGKGEQMRNHFIVLLNVRLSLTVMLHLGAG